MTTPLTTSQYHAFLLYGFEGGSTAFVVESTTTAWRRQHHEILQRRQARSSSGENEQAGPASRIAQATAVSSPVHTRHRRP